MGHQNHLQSRRMWTTMLKKKRREEVVNQSKIVECGPLCDSRDCVCTFRKKPISSFQGHLDDVLDLSWSKSLQFATGSSSESTHHISRIHESGLLIVLIWFTSSRDF
ncbi:hypothetical protein GBA52_013886 [Prunus armeniaca]|nr:hypothetical protein GBA52_013886 [Prunus armeniaca]